MPEYAIWVVYIMIGGVGMPANDEAKFTTESACAIHLRMRYRDFPVPVHCTNIGPLICQGRPCGQ